MPYAVQKAVYLHFYILLLVFLLPLLVMFFSTFPPLILSKHLVFFQNKFSLIINNSSLHLTFKYNRFLSLKTRKTALYIIPYLLSLSFSFAYHNTTIPCGIQILEIVIVIFSFPLFFNFLCNCLPETSSLNFSLESSFCLMWRTLKVALVPGITATEHTQSKQTSKNGCPMSNQIWYPVQGL